MSDKEQKAPQLLKEVSDSFKLQGIKPGRYDFPGFGVVDLTKIDLAKAKGLVVNGFPFLVAKASAEKKAEAAEPVKEVKP